MEKGSKEIVICVTGSIAAVETVKLIRELRREGFKVRCFMSDDACHIIHPYALEFATGQEVILDLTGKIEHVEHAKADLILVAPATANIISKLAYKIADNPISTLLLTAYGYQTPILMVPSMHLSMYHSIRENIQRLKQEGISFLDPLEAENKAKFPDIKDIVLLVKRICFEGDLKGRKVLISAGATFEAIDPVRGITNRSSGKMGLELAKEAFVRGAEVTLLAGQVQVNIPTLWNTIRIDSREEMAGEMEKHIPKNDIFISSAAISDFSTSKQEKKISSKKTTILKLEPAPKLLHNVKKLNSKILLVAFKATYQDLEKEMIHKSRALIEESGADMVVANDLSLPGCGFGSDDNMVILVDDEIRKYNLASKKKIAKYIWDRIIEKI